MLVFLIEAVLHKGFWLCVPIQVQIVSFSLAKVLMKDEGGIRESEEDEDSVDSEESEDND